MHTINVDGLPEPVIRSLETMVQNLKDQFADSPDHAKLSPLERMKRAAGSWVDANEEEFQRWQEEMQRSRQMDRSALSP